MTAAAAPGGPPRLVGVGVGPGDPDLVTVRGVRALEAADVVFVPVANAEETGRAEATVAVYAPAGRIRRLVFALDDRGGVTPRREAAWNAAARAVAEAFAAGARTAVFATIGDPHIYSTFGYLADGVRALVPDLAVSTVPGVTAMQELASRTGTVLCEGTESLALVPATAGAERVDAALAAADTVVAYKVGGARLHAVLGLLRSAGRLDTAVVGMRLGLPDERVVRAAELDADGSAPYLSAVIAPAPRSGRGRRL